MTVDNAPVDVHNEQIHAEQEHHKMSRFLIAILTCCAANAAFSDEKGKQVTYVDLQPIANQNLTDPLHGDYPGNDLAELPQGERTLAEVKFKIQKACVQLDSLELRRVGKKFPAKVKIQVNKSFSKLHILHATGYSVLQSRHCESGLVSGSTQMENIG